MANDDYTKLQGFMNMNDGWAATKNTDTKGDGFTVTTVTRTHEKVPLSKSTIVLENVDVAKFAEAYLGSYDKDPDASEYKLVEKDDTSAVHYLRYKVPIPFVSDRDMLIKGTASDVPEGTFIFVGSTEHADKPEVKKVVRIKFWLGGLLVQDGSNAKFTVCQYSDAQQKMLNSFDPEDIINDMKNAFKMMKK
uniref:START domain-containing protein n=1 Tax=Eucampia antarctica TaxID=49252 RepID=A0A7S2SFG2_9STRA|mmetsp:Transcript_7526/g.7101  ORF Transcript_7526/g.7101 Transcript_7526/m.7101 type:complete len:192 (+) Transcript_7526:82-657(+)|eukprot:CAMPEP_0197828228 /NCGR_PEP_ID=MMETSP1437-20131217/4855_1 /TAXON_ID=49252 ORGANISM="Eucampia antarctica, Strain CCMP1452" /NCGR_SAMPLE_ID=MMETSP1437 /ASSEMBLY_ACC=CAM_ASM_001096 /LENGTH=191 /DNA_ID=CAMNT_0043429393 /DNA_START=81 /DNA_END=656 /DNA_ORIENTATION=+